MKRLSKLTSTTKRTTLWQENVDTPNLKQRILLDSKKKAKQVRPTKFTTGHQVDQLPTLKDSLIINSFKPQILQMITTELMHGTMIKQHITMRQSMKLRLLIQLDIKPPLVHEHKISKILIFGFNKTNIFYLRIIILYNENIIKF